MVERGQGSRRVREAAGSERLGNDHRHSDQGPRGSFSVGRATGSAREQVSALACSARLRTDFPTNEQRLGIQGALEAAGVEFTNGDEPGVKMKATKAGKAK